MARSWVCAWLAALVVVLLPSVCTSSCGDGLVEPDEACDDGNIRGGDGCSPQCKVEKGYSCAHSPALGAISMIQQAKGRWEAVSDIRSKRVQSGGSTDRDRQKLHELQAEAEAAQGLAKEDLLDRIDQLQDQIDESSIKAATVRKMRANAKALAIKKEAELKQRVKAERQAAREEGRKKAEKEEAEELRKKYRLKDKAVDQMAKEDAQSKFPVAKKKEEKKKVVPQTKFQKMAEVRVQRIQRKEYRTADQQSEGTEEEAKETAQQTAAARKGHKEDAAAEESEESDTNADEEAEEVDSSEGKPSVCSAVCGDGVTVVESEQCDDGNTEGGDGCDAECKPEEGFQCTSDSPSVCSALCGDAILTGDEECDDGNVAASDGCSAECHVEVGWKCSSNSEEKASSSKCEPICGDGIRVGDEACDDQNTLDDDGCTSDCTAVEAGYECTPTSGKGMLGSMADVCTKARHEASTPASGGAADLTDLEAGFDQELGPVDPIAAL